MTEVLTKALFAIADGPQRHARYSELAAIAPVHRIALPTGQPGWLITGYEQVRQALNDPRLVRSEAALTMRSREPLSLEVSAAISSHMLNSNPPDHARLLTAAFTRRHIERLAPRIQLELQTLFPTLLDRFPTLRLAVPFESLRGSEDLITGCLVELPVTW